MEKYRFGDATVYVEGDLAISVNEGPVTLEVVRNFLNLVDKIHTQHGHCFLIVDATRIYSVTQDARRYLVDWPKGHQMTGVAVFGANPLMRAVFTLVGRAMKLLGRRSSVVTIYFASEAEARAWVDEQREILGAEDRFDVATVPVTPEAGTNKPID